MRTPQEILAEVRRMQSSESGDLFGAHISDLVEFLPFDLAKEFLKPEVKATDWEGKPADDEAVKARMLDYMPFAWGKANDQRGLSAMRSLAHMGAWLWLLGEEAAGRQMVTYTHYGKPQLRAICEHFGWDYGAMDDDFWDGDKAADVPALQLEWKP